MMKFVLLYFFMAFSGILLMPLFYFFVKRIYSIIVGKKYKDVVLEGKALDDIDQTVSYREQEEQEKESLKIDPNKHYTSSDIADLFRRNIAARGAHPWIHSPKRWARYTGSVFGDRPMWQKVILSFLTRVGVIILLILVVGVVAAAIVFVLARG